MATTRAPRRPAAKRTGAGARPAPSTKPLAERLRVKPGTAVAVDGLPPEVAPLLEPLPAGAKVARGIRADAAFALLFAADAAALRRRLAAAAPKLAPGAILWLGYPKLGGPVASDLSRERVWEVAKPFGLRPVAQIAVDATWSALRFKRAP
jgi:hypothetical protein